MLAIRLQRLGKAHYATYRVIVQDSHRHPTRGRVVAYLGSYNPHTKESEIDKEAASKFLANGAQPTTRVVRLLESHKVALPDWVKTLDGTNKRSIRNPEKLRRNQPKPAEAEPTESAAETKPAE